MPEEERLELGQAGRNHVIDNYNFEKFEAKWVETMDQIIERCSSWSDRRDYQRWHIMEVA